MSTPRKGTRLTKEQIRQWCFAHRERTGVFPQMKSGPVNDQPDISWATVEKVLNRGNRWLPAGSSLAKFLRAEFGVTNRAGKTTLTPPMILQWADAHHARTGRWPVVRKHHLGQDPVPESPGDSWRTINAAMRTGARGYKGPSSLRTLLSKHRGAQYRHWLVPLSLKQIVQWAESHKNRTGHWPRDRSGAIPESPPNTWAGINNALIHGRRGLLGGITLAQLVARHRRVPHRRELPSLTMTQVLRWAHAHHQRAGHWPRKQSGPVHEAPHENWHAIDAAMHQGHRGLPGGVTLVQLRRQQLGGPRRRPSKPITIAQILQWADAYHKRTGDWPMRTSGPIGGGVKGTWAGVQHALQQRLRGLPKSSLAAILLRHRNVRRGNNRLCDRDTMESS